VLGDDAGFRADGRKVRDDDEEDDPLAKKEGMSTSDFRAYWSGSHAKLALGMDGIARYVHNRVE
jgi:hypothetical protein